MEKISFEKEEVQESIKELLEKLRAASSKEESENTEMESSIKEMVG